MTWAKLSDDFADQCAKLSDEAFRTHVEALIWTMRRETDGHLTKREVTKLAESDLHEAAVTELVDKGYWERTEDGYRVLHHMEHQPESDIIAFRRQRAAQRQRRSRRQRVARAVEVEQREVDQDGLDGAPRITVLPRSVISARPVSTRPDPGHIVSHAVTQPPG